MEERKALYFRASNSTVFCFGSKELHISFCTGSCKLCGWAHRGDCWAEPRASLRSIASGALTPLGAGSVLVSGFTFTASSPCFVFFPHSGHSFSDGFLKEDSCSSPTSFPSPPPTFFPILQGVSGERTGPLGTIHAGWPLVSSCGSHQ